MPFRVVHGRDFPLFFNIPCNVVVSAPLGCGDCHAATTALK